MKSIILHQFGTGFFRVVQGRGVSEKQFDFFVNNSRLLGVTGWYVDDKELFESNFTQSPVDWGSIETRTLEKSE